MRPFRIHFVIAAMAVGLSLFTLQEVKAVSTDRGTWSFDITASTAGSGNIVGSDITQDRTLVFMQIHKISNRV